MKSLSADTNTTRWFFKCSLEISSVFFFSIQRVFIFVEEFGWYFIIFRS